MSTVGSFPPVSVEARREGWDAGGMTDQHRLVDDIDTWAPIGWTPSDVGWQDDEPFGSVLGDPLMGSPLFDVSAFDAAPELTRSEERRVGKECRSRWSPYH